MPIVQYLVPPMPPQVRTFRREPLTLRRRIRQKLFVWRLAAGRRARRTLLMRQSPVEADGLMRLPIRGLAPPLLLRAGPSDDRQTVWELFFHEVYGGLLPCTHRTVLDLGANVGLTLAWLLRRGAPIERYIGVEPDPETFFVLRKQVEALGMAGRSALFNVAASDRAGTVRFSTSGTSITHQVVQGVAQGDIPLFADRDAGATGSARGEKRNVPFSAGGDLEVPSRTVGKILDDAGLSEVDLMKLDIEGGERQVVADARNWARRVKRIAAELHYDMDAAWLRSQLAPLGFQVFDEGVLFREAVGAVREDVAHELPGHLR